jgi:lipopolysaccharide/colanic/teichoic acid biosynthesis glycosyltransferase
MSRLDSFQVRDGRTRAWRPKRTVQRTVAAHGAARHPGALSGLSASGIPSSGGVDERSWSRFSAAVMRAVDVGIALLALVILGPLTHVIALTIWMTSKGPILFRQTRVGYEEQPFAMLKFRSMYVDCDDKLHREYVTHLFTARSATPNTADGCFKLENDSRITWVGGFLRRTSLDELPQLFNVLRGEMSLVGPRPALPWEVDHYEEHHHLRFQVKPGITGLWQVQGRNRLSIAQALELDVTYVRNRTLGLNIRILLRTLPAVVRGDGAR